MKRICLIVCCISVFLECSYGQETEHAIAVTILKAELATRTVYVKTASGTDEIFRFTQQTPVTSLAEAAINRSLYGGAGYQFIIHYNVKPKEKVATSFDYVGRGEWKSSTGDLLSVDSKARTVVLKTTEGAEQTFFAGEHCAIESPSGARKFAVWVVGSINVPASVTIRFFEVNGRSVAHLLEFTGDQTVP